MLTRLYVNGFRSLDDFTIHFNKGLNVLVGPNGSGKSNILDAISFAARVVTSGATTALHEFGGINRVFRLIDGSRRVDRLRIEIEGMVINPIAPTASSSAEVIERLEIHLGFRICFELFCPKGDLVEIQNQEVSYCVIDEPAINNAESLTPKLNDNLAFVETFRLVQTESSEFKIDVFDEDKIGPYNKKLLSNQGGLAGFLESILSTSTSTDDSVLYAASPFLYYLHCLKMHMYSLNTMMIDPAKIVSGDDLTAHPILRGDGTGCLAVLRSIERSRDGTFSEGNSTDFLEYIISKLSMAIESVRGVRTIVDDWESKIRLYLSVDAGEGRLINLPAHSVSHGTLKWLAMIIGLRFNPFFSIEEPENHLHPWMQQELVRMIEAEIEEGGDFVSLVSTHSETLLNLVPPEQVIVISYVNGRTVAKRIPDPAHLSSVISETGFGLGYHYISGALSG